MTAQGKRRSWRNRLPWSKEARARKHVDLITALADDYCNPTPAFEPRLFEEPHDLD